MNINHLIPSGIRKVIESYTTEIKKLKERPIIIAIDGHSSCGKSTLSKDLAQIIGYRHIDTGAMYRAVTLYLLRQEIPLSDPTQVAGALNDIRIDFQRINGANHTFLNDEDVEKHIRGLEVSSHVSEVAAISAVRRFLVEQQRVIGQQKSIVMDGRDIGSVVFPEAELKIFMTADVDVRTQRRYEEMIAKGSKESYDTIKANLLHRDHIDSTRSDSPLLQADDAIVIDSSTLSRQDQLNKAIELAVKAVG